jgi:hypothetical protein
MEEMLRKSLMDRAGLARRSEEDRGKNRNLVDDDE